MTDRDIVQLFLDRNEEAIQAADEKYGRQMSTLARRILPSQEDAEECCSDTLLKLWNSIPPDIPRKLYSYVMQIIRRTALDRLDWITAKRRHAEVIPITEELENILCEPAKNMDEDEILKKIEAFLDTQEKKNRILFVRRYFYSDTIEQIAEEFGMSRNNVSVTLHRIRSRLRDYLEKEGVYL